MDAASGLHVPTMLRGALGVAWMDTGDADGIVFLAIVQCVLRWMNQVRFVYRLRLQRYNIEKRKSSISGYFFQESLSGKTDF